MHRVILFRHGKTEARPAGRGDFERVLVEQGRTDSAAVGNLLADAGYAPDLALISPAVRASQTWDCIKARFPRARIEFRPSLYEASLEEVEAEMAAGRGEADTIMLVGHNPSLHELAVNLLVEGAGSAVDIESLSAGFPPAAAAVFCIDAAGRAQLEALFHPRDHRNRAAPSP